MMSSDKDILTTFNALDVEKVVVRQRRRILNPPPPCPASLLIEEKIKLRNDFFTGMDMGFDTFF